MGEVNASSEPKNEYIYIYKDKLCKHILDLLKNNVLQLGNP